MVIEVIIGYLLIKSGLLFLICSVMDDFEFYWICLFVPIVLLLLGAIMCLFEVPVDETTEQLRETRERVEYDDPHFKIYDTWKDDFAGLFTQDKEVRDMFFFESINPEYRKE